MRVGLLAAVGVLPPAPVAAAVDSSIWIRDCERERESGNQGFGKLGRNLEIQSLVGLGWVYVF